MKILCFGDSITRGVTLQGNRLRIVKQTYPKHLQAARPNDEIVNKGVFNDNSSSLLQRFDKDVVAEHPDVTLLEIGGNDCVFNWQEVANAPDDVHQPTVRMQDFKQNIRTLYDRLTNIGSKLVLVTPPPLDPVKYYEYLENLFDQSISKWICKVGGIDFWHKQYNDAIVQLSEELHLLLIDVRKAFIETDHFQDFMSNDGIHPNEEGYVLMAQTIEQTIK
ncbi:SGNH/GDSL hydrolase family protein [Kurthia senegalensis]|uniref:SGNH/GDSL hydrolase family protein n=1 Tax=Kurthia senegalensis TaxID=1033740 RepID=UPI000288A150|nr:SGNH/GDSL hydrolase family protein [Kurthia senegalensis]